MFDGPTASPLPPPGAATDGDFKTQVRARRNELLGLWAAGHMGFDSHAAATYARMIVKSGITQPDDWALVAAIASDLRESGCRLSEGAIWTELAQFAAIATLELGGEPRSAPIAA